MKKTYLGDGVYAQYDRSAEHIILTAEDGFQITNVLYVDNIVADRLIEFIKDLQQDMAIDREVEKNAKKS